MKDSHKYYYDREMIEFHRLEAGEYVVVPSTMMAYVNADYVLTIYSKIDTEIR